MFIVRKETKKDRLEVERLIYRVLKEDDKPCYEHYKICRLRGTKDFNKELTFVAEEDDKIVGFLTLSRGIIKNENEEIETLILYPLVVHDEYRVRGIGKTLIKAALDEAKYLGYSHVFVYGDKDYFGKYGFASTGAYQITNENGKKEKMMLVHIFKLGSLNDVSGTLMMSPTFKEIDEKEFEYYHQALHVYKKKQEISAKTIKKINLILSIVFVLAAIVLFILSKNNIVGVEVGLGSILFAIGGCLACIAFSHALAKQYLMTIISGILSLIVLIFGFFVAFG